jgi:hypothetical protein
MIIRLTETSTGHKIRLCTLSKTLVRNFSLQISIYWVTLHKRDRDSLGYGLGYRIITVGFSAEQEMFSPNFLGQRWDPCSFLFKEYVGVFPRGKLTGTKGYALVPSSRIRGTVFPFPHAGIHLKAEPKCKATPSESTWVINFQASCAADAYIAWTAGAHNLKCWLSHKVLFSQIFNASVKTWVRKNPI